MIPLWLKIAYTAMVCLIVPVYWRHYGPKNFLWFSDIALIGLVPALWMESSLVASMMAVSVLLPEILWNISYLSGLLTPWQIRGLTGYMFDRQYPLYLRSLSLFHVFLPPLLLYLVWRLGYDERALIAQTILAWIVVPITYAAKPKENINWVYGLGNRRLEGLSPLGWVALLMLLYPLLIYVPTHFLLRALFE